MDGGADELAHRTPSPFAQLLVLRSSKSHRIPLGTLLIHTFPCSRRPVVRRSTGPWRADSPHMIGPTFRQHCSGAPHRLQFALDKSPRRTYISTIIGVSK